MKIALAIVAPIAALALGLTGPAHGQAAPKVHLQVVGNLGITTQSKELEQPFWTKDIPAASGGSITASIKPWNEMGLKGPEVFKMLSQGVFDVGTAQLGHVAGDSPINDATDLAGVSDTLDTFQKVQQSFRPTLEKYYESQLKSKVLGLWSYQAQVLYCRDPIKGLADLKGRKVRTSGASQSDFISYFGGAGINMAFGEVQQALQNGVVDCAITGTLGGYKAKWFEGTKFLYPLPINWGAGLSAINLNSWKKLSADQQKVLLSEYARLEKAIYDQNRREHEIGVACNTAGPCPEGPPGKMTLEPILPGDAELRKKALLEQVLPRWASRCGADCVKTWNDTVGKVVNLTAKAN